MNVIFFLKNITMKNNRKSLHAYDILQVITWFVMYSIKIINYHFPWLNHYQVSIKAKTLKTKVSSS